MAELRTVESLIENILGKWCDHCKRITSPYKSEDGRYPCCNGCWHEYSYWDTHSDFGIEKAKDLPGE